MNLLWNWLLERIDHGLHSFQLSALSHIVRVRQLLTYSFIDYKLIGFDLIETIYLLFKSENIFGF